MLLRRVRFRGGDYAWSTAKRFEQEYMYTIYRYIFIVVQYLRERVAMITRFYFKVSLPDRDVRVYVRDM